MLVVGFEKFVDPYMDQLDLVNHNSSIEDLDVKSAVVMAEGSHTLVYLNAVVDEIGLGGSGAVRVAVDDYLA